MADPNGGVAQWIVREIEDGHAILMTSDARRTYPRQFAVDEVIEWEHQCDGAQAREVEKRLALIAAAPDLLAACKLALSAFEHQRAIDWDDLYRAIAKAEGKPNV